MSSINEYFTIQYSQPEEYRFSHDSVFLARRVFELVKNEISHKRVLDLCSGCGVVGLDFIFHLQSDGFKLPDRIDFIEVQEIYQKHFIKNISQFQSIEQYEYLNLNYEKVFNIQKLSKRYDLILSNPPYFYPELGALSDSDFKNRCRFFIDSTLEKLILAIEYLLSQNGEAYILLKNLEAHGVSIESELKKINHHLNIKKIEKIRETDLYLMSHL